MDPQPAAGTVAAPNHPPQLQRIHEIQEIRPLPPFKPDLYQRGWSSTPHPTLPLLATTHNKSVTIFSLVTFSAHSALTGGHSRSVRSATWKPGLPPHRLCLVTGSFDSTAGLWRWEQNTPLPSGRPSGDDDDEPLETDVANVPRRRRGGDEDADDDGGSGEEDDEDEDGWEFTLVLEGQEHEIKSVAFSPSGQYLATCSRDKSVWIWEDVGGDEEDEWETVAVLNEHEGDVKAVAWCPDVPGCRSGSGRHYGLDVLASTSYDNTIRLWREDGDGEWVCVAVLEGHEGTVWGVQWESDPDRKQFPRLLSWSADQTLRVWTLQEEEDEQEGQLGGSSGAPGGGGPLFRSMGGMPNTMRRSLREEWACTAVLPKAHTRDIYSATWSGSTGLVASTGSDGTIVVYGEVDEAEAEEEDDDGTGHSHGAAASEAEAAAELDGDVPMSQAHGHHDGHSHGPINGTLGVNGVNGHGHAKTWRILGTVATAHGPYEINNVTWCRRFDPGTDRRGVEEMLVSTGDDGIVRPWQIVTGS